MSAAHAQSEAAVVGTVTDETKAVLPGVTVTATDVATGRQFVGVTDQRGDYRLPSMTAGLYKIQAELVGFTTVVLPEVELLVGQNRTVLFVLKLATVQETLTVRGEAPLVDTRSAAVAGNVDRRQMEEPPISGRNWIELAMLVKGVTANDVGEGRPGTFRDGEFRINLDGQEITQAVSATVAFGQPGLSREAIAEYQVVTNLFEISLGANTGVNRARPDLTVVPRNAFNGLPLHKLDLRGSKEFKLSGNVKVMGIAEVFNLFNHANYGNYQALVNTSTFGNAVQNSANMYLPRSGQFAFKLTF